MPRKKIEKKPLNKNNKETKTRENPYYLWIFVLNIDDGQENTDTHSPEALWNMLKGYCKTFRFSLEKGGEKNHLHYQGCLSLKDKERFTSLKNRFGYNDVHLEPAKHWLSCMNYVKKQETHIDGPWDETFEWIWTISELNFWQKDIVEFIKIPNLPQNNREIIWFYDEIGGRGKTVLCNYLGIKMKADILRNGKNKDLSYILSDKPKIVIFDFVRTNEGRINYGMIEDIKDGRVFCPKYESKNKRFNSPHVIIFANFKPDESTLSQNRWRIFNLETYKEFDLCHKETLNLPKETLNILEEINKTI